VPGLTPSQTVGPYFAMRLPWPDGPFVVPEGTPGAITIIGRLYDGAGNIIPDGLIETWQAGPDGRFAHPDDPRGATPAGYQSFRGFGRCPTAHAADPVLCSIGELTRRATLIAMPEPEGQLRFDIRLQGDRETVFFDV